jgi:sirohydrochlorin ferrochelatase
MDGVIILAHGSKREETEKILNSLVAQVQAKVASRVAADLIYPAYLQFSGQNLEVAVRHLADRGVTAIKIVPLFLFDGIHVTEDIPEELRRLRKLYPQICLTLTRHLGDDPRIAAIVAERLLS